MNGTQDLNLNSTDCLVNKMDFGSQTVTNICTGAAHTVPWGSADWALAVILFLFAVAVIGMFAAMGLSIARG